MKKSITVIGASLAAVVTLSACAGGGSAASGAAFAPVEERSWVVQSPDKSITATVGMDTADNLYYSVVKDGVTVVEKSELGLDIREDDLNVITFVRETPRRVKGKYKNKTGKHSTVEYDCYETKLTFKAWEHYLDIYMRAYDDGYAFRYGLRKIDGSEGEAKIDGEKTSFTIPNDSTLWTQLYAPYTNFTVVDELKDENIDTFAYERSSYNRTFATELTGNDKVTFPVLYKPDSESDVYSLVTESELIGSGFYGSVLQSIPQSDSLKLQTVPTPAGSIEDDGKVSLPFESPWRVGITGSLADVVESELVEKVYDSEGYWRPDNYEELSAEEQAIYSYDWVEPDVTCWSWIIYRADDQNNFAIHKAYLDKCADMGWKYLLLDGGWSNTYTHSGTSKTSGTNLAKDGITDTDVPPDWNSFVEYANSKGIKLFVWGDAIRTFSNSNYDVLCDTLDRWVDMGISGVKLDFWDGARLLRDSGQMPIHRGEDSENIKWYDTVLQECAKRKILVNCHGCNKPTGARRKYPNLINMEGIQGAEMNSNTAVGTINQLFTRAVIGPSDFTPMLKPNKHQFTRGFMLSLAILFEGQTTVGDTMTELNNSVIRDLYTDLPVLRDDTKFLCGEPNNYYCAAVRYGDDWFIACANGLVANDIKINFSFLGDGEWSGFLYEDDPEFIETAGNSLADIVKTAKNGYTKSSKETFNVKATGGFVLHLKKQK